MPNIACLNNQLLKFLGLTLFILPWSLVQATTQCSNVTIIPITECEVLLTLYNQTNGATWQKNTGWNENNTPCQWWGVNCDNGYVTKLYLENNNLNGSIPDSLGQLNQLQELSLSNNQLSHFIPDSLGQLRRLRILYLSGNHLESFIPNSLGNLVNLQGLYLNSNQLNGSIPESLGNLEQLQTLSLNNNQLNAAIPESLGNLRHLQGLDLSHNQLTGSIPRPLINLKKLQRLKLDYNQLSGTLPEWLEKLSNLQWLVLNDNQLSGSIPNSFGNLNYLQVLYLDNNQLTGIIPESLGNLANLQQLVLENNQFSGTIPEALGNLNNLQDLYLSNNELCGDIPSTLMNLTGLSYLSLDDNHLTYSDSNLFIWTNKLNSNWLSTQTPCLKNSPAKLNYQAAATQSLTNENSTTNEKSTCLLYALQDEGLNNSQFFTVDPQNHFATTPLGNIYPEYDIEDMDILSATTEIYASSGDNAQANHEKGYLYQVNSDNGELTPICSTGLGKVSAISFYPDSQDLWLWAGGKGLFVIDLKQINNGVCYPQEIFHYSAQVEGITWDSEGQILYGAKGTTLYKYFHDTGTVAKACDNFPKGVEALEISSEDGLLLFALHQANDTAIHLFDINRCAIVDGADFPIETPYNDIEGIAWTCHSE
ncbi:MAG: hypothetical protein HC877_05835 [Thioploca sp.]|nr:hypothetical protein [Thioploca sp.]